MGISNSFSDLVTSGRSNDFIVSDKWVATSLSHEMIKQLLKLSSSVSWTQMSAEGEAWDPQVVLIVLSGAQRVG